MFLQAKKRTQDLTFVTTEYDTFKQIMNSTRGFIKAFWCESRECEQNIKDETKATTRCLPFSDSHGTVQEESGSCIKCGKPAAHKWLFAQAY